MSEIYYPYGTKKDSVNLDPTNYVFDYKGRKVKINQTLLPAGKKGLFKGYLAFHYWRQGKRKGKLAGGIGSGDTVEEALASSMRTINSIRARLRLRS